MNSSYVASEKTFKTKITERRNFESVKAFKFGYVSKDDSFGSDYDDDDDEENEIICITEIPLTIKKQAQMQNLKGFEK